MRVTRSAATWPSAKCRLIRSGLVRYRVALLGLGFLATAAAHAPAGTVAGSRRPQAVSAYAQLPLQFEVNRGQGAVQVRFLSHGRGFGLFLTPREVLLFLNPSQQLERKNSGSPSVPKPIVLRTKLVGANPTPSVTGLHELPGRVNYFVGDDPKKWLTDISTYAKVKYEDIYPGIDLVYHGTQKQLEYDFVVAPGADPKAITLHFEGAGRLELDDGGDLLLRTARARIRQRKPLIFQEVDGVRKEVPGGYMLKGKHRVGFQVGAYDSERPLVIDPVLVYSTYLGGSIGDAGKGIAVDPAGNIYVAGGTGSTDFPTFNPLYPSRFADAFVAKLTPDGSALHYSTYLGGGNGDSGTGIAVDSDGNAYVTGLTYSNDFPTQNPLQASYSGGADAFVAKLNPSGSELIYSTYLGGTNTDEAYGVTVDSPGNAYVAGRTQSLNFPTWNPLQPARGGSLDAFVAKLNPNGSAFIYSTYLGGSVGCRPPPNSGRDAGHAIAVDSAGNAYVTGWTESNNFPRMNPIQPVHGGAMDAFVAMLNAAGSALVYSTYLGGTMDDWGYGIAAGSDGTAYVTGSTNSTNFPTANPLQPTLRTGDAFVTKIVPGGSSFVYSTYLGGGEGESGSGIAVDSLGNAYVTGYTNSTDFPTANPLQQTLRGILDDFVAKLNPTGSTLLFSTYLGGSGIEQVLPAIAVDSAGNAYVTGMTGSADFPTQNPFQPGAHVRFVR